MDLLQAALLFNGTLVLAFHLARRRWLRSLHPLFCLALVQSHPGWGMALLFVPQPKLPLTPELKAFEELTKARQWKEATDAYGALKKPPAWVHLLACRAYARQQRFEEALQALKQTSPTQPQLPPHYACMTMALTGSQKHLDQWLPRLTYWPEHSRLHTRALCRARAGQEEEAQALWDQAAEIAPPDYLTYIEEDRANPEPGHIEPETLKQLQLQFERLDRDSRMAHAPLGPQAKLLILLTCAAYALPPHYLSRSSFPLGLFTSMFSHYNLPHLALNMVSLAALAPLVELLYPRRFLALYFVSGAVAGLAQLAITPQAHLLGASGAVMSLLGARLALLTRFPNKMQLLLLLLILGGQMVIDQLVPQMGSIAHVWGAFSGFLITLAGPSPALTKKTA